MRGRVLVIDDEDHIRRVMRMTLEAAGYEVGEGADGPRGLEAFGDGLAWDVVLLDQRMPGMDGLETLRRMRERRADVRVIMITAYASIELAVDAMKLGARDFVRKPMTPEIVRNAVAAAMARPAAASPAPPPDEALRRTHPPSPGSPSTAFASGRRPASTRGIRRTRRSADSSSSIPMGRSKRWSLKLIRGRWIRRARRRSLPLDNSFWTWEAEHALNNFLWNEERFPRRKLTLPGWTATTCRWLRWGEIESHTSP
jgi:DNA-binding response OmpR family regulator